MTRYYVKEIQGNWLLILNKIKAYIYIPTTYNMTKQANNPHPATFLSCRYLLN